MAFETKVNEGSLWKNEKMKDEKSAPYTGSIKIECPHCKEATEYWQSAYVNEVKKTGKKFFGQKFNPKNPAPTQTQKTPPEDMDVDSIPF